MTVIVVAIIACVQLLALAWLQGRQSSRKSQEDAAATSAALQQAAAVRHQEREEDYARQDLVAQRVADAATQTAKAAKLLLNAQATTIAKTDEVARLSAEATTTIQQQLDTITTQSQEIHSLVNGGLTLARKNELAQTKLTLLALKRVQTLSLDLGQKITDAEIAAIAVAESRIVELQDMLLARRKIQFAIDTETDAH